LAGQDWTVLCCENWRTEGRRCWAELWAS